MQPNVLTIIGVPLFFVSLLEIILGAVLLTSNPRKSLVLKAAAAFTFFAASFALNTGAMYILAGTGRDVTLLARANWIGWLVIPAAFQFIYSTMDESDKRAHIAGMVLYPLWVAVLCVSLLTELITKSGYTLVPYIDHDGPFAKPLRIIGVLQICLLLFEVYRLRRRASGIKRAQLNYFTYGLLIFTMGAVMVAGVLQLAGKLSLGPGLASYLSLPWVVLMFYTMTRYRLFDIRSALSGFAAIVLLSAFYFIIQAGLLHILSPVLGMTGALAVSLFAIGALFYGTTLNRKVQRVMRRLIVQDRFDYQQVLKEAGKAMITILDRDKLLKYLVDSIKTGLSIERVCLFLGDSDGQFRMRQSADKLSEVCGDGIIDSFVVHCAKQDGILVREELAERSAGEDVVRLSRWMQTAGAEIIIPLLFKGELQGLLALGRRADAELFGASDLEILEMLANHAAIAIENARLYDEALHAKESLRESDEKFRTLAHTMPAAIFIHRGGKFLYANSVAEAMTGYTNEEFLSMEFWGLVHPDYLSMVQERGLSRLQNDAFPPQYEFKIIRKDREERWALMTASRMEYEGSPAVIGTLFDVTERKALEGQLRYAQKMEAIGKLAGGVAHDFNNVLTAIVGYANVLQARLGKDDTLRGFVDNILAATERAANMTQSLLAFGKKQSVTMSNADLNELVLRMKKLLSGLLHSGTELIIQSADCALPVLADGSQIERIIMNLLVNARDAMPRGGTVTIATSTAELGHDFIRKFGYGKAGPYALVSVSDTGIGMDEEVRGRIFEPFFTTKGLEKGTGFGLSIVYDIVKDHQGYITVDSEIGKGTTFTVYLPLQAVATERPVQKPVVREVRGTETILVVENEEEVREVVKAVLQAYGYTVIEAGDGEEAVEKFIRHKSAVHLLILDVIMPKMNGFEAYQAIRKKQPTIRALFTSGYSETVVQTKGLLEQGHLFIEKPFSPKELLSRVRQALDATPPRSSSLSPLSSRVGN